MEFFHAVSTRHSIRVYQEAAVAQDQLDKILQTANLAPSAGDLQAYAIVVVQEAATRAFLATAAHGQGFLATAPVIMVFCSDPQRSAARYAARGEQLFSIQDATIAASFAWLQAVASGLGACWVGAFDDEAVKNIFRQKIGPDWRPIALLPVGYGAE